MSITFNKTLVKSDNLFLNVILILSWILMVFSFVIISILGWEGISIVKETGIEISIKGFVRFFGYFSPVKDILGVTMAVFGLYLIIRQVQIMSIANNITNWIDWRDKFEAKIKWLKDDTFKDLDLHIAFSTFGMSHKYDNHSHRQMIKNLQVDINCKRSIEFRPVCYGINDSYETIEDVFKEANGLAIGYSGLQGKPETVEYWNEKGYDFKPFPGFNFGHKKSISNDVQKYI